MKACMFIILLNVQFWHDTQKDSHELLERTKMELVGACSASVVQDGYEVTHEIIMLRSD